MAIEYYDDGTVTVSAGSMSVTGTGTAWTLFGVAGGVLVADGLPTAIPVSAVEGDTELTLAWASPVALAGASYAIYLVPADAAKVIRMTELQAQIMARNAVVAFRADARGSLAGRAAHDGEAEGFQYGIIDNPPFYEFYEKASDATGDWAGPFQWYGPGGEDGVDASLATLLAAATPHDGADAPTLAVDIDLGNKLFHEFVIEGDRTLGFPTDVPNAGITFYVKVSQDGTGSHSLGFADGYVGSRGVLPTISDLANAETLLCVVMLEIDRAAVFTVGQDFA